MRVIVKSRRFLEFEEDWRRWEADIGTRLEGPRIRPNEIIHDSRGLPRLLQGLFERGLPMLM